VPYAEQSNEVSAQQTAAPVDLQSQGRRKSSDAPTGSMVQMTNSIILLLSILDALTA